MWLKSLLKSAKITRVSNAAAAGTTDIESSRVDMSGFDSVCFVALLGDGANTAVVQMVAKSNPADSTTGSTTEKTGTSSTLDATSGDNKLVIVDTMRPTHRYAYCTLILDTANVAVDGILAIQYNAKHLPTTQGSTVLSSDLGGPSV
jgi:hypothetical protein